MTRTKNTSHSFAFQRNNRRTQFVYTNSPTHFGLQRRSHNRSTVCPSFLRTVQNTDLNHFPFSCTTDTPTDSQGNFTHLQRNDPHPLSPGAQPNCSFPHNAVCNSPSRVVCHLPIPSMKTPAHFQYRLLPFNLQGFSATSFGQRSNRGIPRVLITSGKQELTLYKGGAK